MADISAPFIPQATGYRLVSDEFVLEFLYFDKDVSNVVTEKDVSGWEIGFEIKNDSDPTYGHIIPNNSGLIDRTIDNRIRLRAKTAAIAGLDIPISGELKPYWIRYYQIINADGAQRTIRDIDVNIVKRLPDAVNTAGPQLAETFRTTYTAEGQETVDTELAELLQSQMQSLQAQMSALSNDQLLSVDNFAALDEVDYQSVDFARFYQVLNDDDSTGSLVQAGLYILWPTGQITRASNNDEFRPAQ